MVDVYFYLPAEKAEIAVECGIKLSEWHSREVSINGEIKKCLCAFLNPRDDIAAYKSHQYRCVKLEVNPKYCYVADGFLYRLGVGNEEARKMYDESVTPVEEYRFGKYRLPECLIACTVLGDSIRLLERKLDAPILFGSSEELYFNNLVEGFRDAHEDFNDASLYYLLDALSAAGGAVKLEDAGCGKAVFVESGSGRIITLNIPDIRKYIYEAGI